MGACNGCQWYPVWGKGNTESLEPPTFTFKEIIVVPDYPEREADEKLLAEIATKPDEVTEMY